MKIRASIGIALALGLCCAAATPAVSDPPPKPVRPPQACFWARDVDGFNAVDERTVYLRVGVHDVYQLKLFGSCPDIDWDMHIGLRSRGSSWVCEGSGLDVEIYAPSPIGPQHCPVTAVHKLSPEEIAALPKKQRP